MDWLRRPALFPGRVTPAGGGAEASLSVLSLARRAWTERQQDGHQALLWATQVLEALPGLALAGKQGVQLQGRMTLILAEVHLQHLRLDDAEQAAAQARALFAAVDDACGLADVCWLHHMLAADRGDTQALRQSLQEALRHAERAAEPERQLYFRIVMARSDMLQDAEQARQAWAGRLPESAEGLSSMCAAALADYLGVREGLLSHFAASANWFELGFEQALASGQLRRAMALASNLGFTFTAASDYARAIDWLQRGLALARKAGWPGSIGLCLAQTGEAMRRVGQVAAARELLQECLDTLDGHPVSRTILLALSYLGQVELDSDHAPQALALFETLVSRALQVGSTDLRLDGELGRARSLHRLHRLDDARGVAQAALGLAQQLQQQTMRVELLWLLTAIARSAGATSAVVLEGLSEAVTLAGAIEGYRAPPGLLEEAAEALAAAGRHEEAYAHARRAALVRRDSLSDEAAKRAAALHLHQQIEAMSAEREHLRRLAEAESARAQALEDAHQVLTHLSRIGQEITAELVAERVFEALERHVHALLPVSCMAIYLLDETRTQLVCAFGVEEAQAFVDPPVPVDEVHSYCARCVRERRGFVLGIDERPHEESQVPGTSEMHSVMFSPLMISERVVGVMTVQTPKVAAYGHREELIFASLCAYAAIALDNARAYLRLSELQRHVMAQEKLAALGAMVAGVAHELNTPIGNSLLVASALLSDARDFETQVQRGALRRSDWQLHAERTREGLEVIERCMDTAAALVRSFKQVAVDRSAEQRRPYELLELCQQCQQSLGLMLRRAGVHLQLSVPQGLMLQGYPGALSQVLVILINNAVTHAFEGREQGRLLLESQLVGLDQVHLSLSDDGVGMSEAVLRRVFEPFFTTKFGQGGSGLGLSICLNIVETLLGGRIRVSSEPGQGSRFVLELPLVAP
ncbi:GAF domain-containing sensor histidine kinase [Pelomonas sp. APW6]|uniref:histidine kinase n=1 Tax=Roseateles subflavus TaxID=3053353 RepID=A0ABT7LFN6_9BURK|nr:GAF domain-containing sensor histidine kinase [Pelomonas sp. APW6]MDL5031107.1 GAF domain-containing sensor histidine kinase [Pelomonas sp. APW6]